MLTQHPAAEDLALFAAGYLGGSELLRLAEHVEVCDECRQQSRDLAKGPKDHQWRADYTRRFAEDLVEATIAGHPPTIRSDLRDVTIALGAASGGSTAELRKLRAQVLFAEAWFGHENGSVADALERSITARELFLELGDEFNAARALIAESRLLGIQRRVDEAIGAADGALKIFQRHGDLRRARIAKSSVGAALLHANRHAEALPIFKRLVEAVPHDDPDRVHWLLDVANCAFAMGDVARVEMILASLLPENDFLRVNWKWGLAEVHARRGRIATAIDELMKVRVEARNLNMGLVEVSIACNVVDLMMAVGRTEEAATLAREVIAYFLQENLIYLTREPMAHLRSSVGQHPMEPYEELRHIRIRYPQHFDARVYPVLAKPADTSVLDRGRCNSGSRPKRTAP